MDVKGFGSDWILFSKRFGTVSHWTLHGKLLMLVLHVAVKLVFGEKKLGAVLEKTLEHESDILGFV